MKKFDFHVHFHNDITVEQMAYYFKDMCERKGYEGVGLMSIIHSEDDYPDCNEKALKLKELLPNSIAFGALFPDRDMVEQTKELMAKGFSGIKMLYGKPSEYMHFGFGYEDKRFDEFFAYAEENQIPLLIHNNDPKLNWDISKATPRAIEKGWVYDDKVPSQEWFFRALEKRLEDHKNLKVALAHFGFYADDIKRATRLMEMCPNLYMDITPAIEIYTQLSERRDEAEEFFRKYYKRIFYGTDAESHLEGFAREYNDTKTEIITAFLEGKEPVEIKGRKIVPIKLEQYMLEDIYYNNCMEFIK